MTPPLRIGYDIGKALGVKDGIGTYTRMLARGLMAVDSESEYLLYDLFEPALDTDRLTEVVGELPANFRPAPTARPRSGDVDLFHSPAFRLPPSVPVPLVFTLHDLTFISHPGFHTLANRVVSMTSMAEAVARAERIIAVSEATRRAALDLLNLDEERVTVIHEAAEPVYQPVTDRRRLNDVLDRLGVDLPYVLAVGSLEPRKNLPGLVEGFRRLPRNLRDTHALVVVGSEGWLNDPIYAELRQAARSFAVVHAGMVGQSDLVALYTAARAFAYVSFAEGFGLPVLEAMACGAPVITSSVSSLPEVAGDAAEMVDPEDPQAICDALTRVLADDGHSEELRRRGRARASRFDWQISARKTLEVYREVGQQVARPR